jgi:hypothetical protein
VSQAAKDGHKMMPMGSGQELLQTFTCCRCGKDIYYDAHARDADGPAAREECK